MPLESAPGVPESPVESPRPRGSLGAIFWCVLLVLLLAVTAVIASVVLWQSYSADELHRALERADRLQRNQRARDEEADARLRAGLDAATSSLATLTAAQKAEVAADAAAVAALQASIAALQAAPVVSYVPFESGQLQAIGPGQYLAIGASFSQPGSTSTLQSSQAPASLLSAAFNADGTATNANLWVLAFSAGGVVVPTSATLYVSTPSGSVSNYTATALSLPFSTIGDGSGPLTLQNLTSSALAPVLAGQRYVWLIFNNDLVETVLLAVNGGFDYQF